MLDPLILFHEFAFAPQFAALRYVEQSVRPAETFAATAARYVQRARGAVRDSGDAEMCAAVERVLDDHPALTRPFWQLWHRIRKHLPR